MPRRRAATASTRFSSSRPRCPRRRSGPSAASSCPRRVARDGPGRRRGEWAPCAGLPARGLAPLLVRQAAPGAARAAPRPHPRRAGAPRAGAGVKARREDAGADDAERAPRRERMEKGDAARGERRYRDTPQGWSLDAREGAIRGGAPGARRGRHHVVLTDRAASGGTGAAPRLAFRRESSQGTIVVLQLATSIWYPIRRTTYCCPPAS